MSEQFTHLDANDFDKLNKQLLELPSLIYDAEIALSETIDASENSKLTIELAEASKYLVAEGKTVKEKDSNVLLALEEKLRAQIETDTKQLKAKALFNKLTNQFNAVRKVAGNVEARINSKI